MVYKNKMGLIGSLDINRPKYKILYWAIFCILIILAIICIVPPLWIMLSSVKDIKEFYATPPTIIPHTWNFKKVIDAWNKYSFVKYYINTGVLTLGCILSAVCINGLAGYVLSKLKPKGVTLIFALIMWSMMIPSQTSMVPIYKNIVSLNMINTHMPMYMMYASRAFKVIVFKNFFDSIPDSLLESARLDGCRELGIFTKIILPLSKAGVATMVILTLKESWSEFFWPFLVLRDRDKYTVMVEMYMIQNQIAVDELVILISFSIIPPVILFLIFQKNIMQGFASSGIKG